MYQDLLYMVHQTYRHELLMPLAETIKEFDSFILRGVDLIDHTSIFLLRTVNHYVTLIMCTRYRKTKT